MDRVLLGSQTAKNGFKNEKDIAFKFENWKIDCEARKWLSIMGYDLNEIDYVKAKLLSKQKADINLQIMIKFKDVIDIQNIQIKLVSNNIGFNQIDKRWVDSYAKLWDIPQNIVILLKHFTGELKPLKANTKDSRRMYLTEFSNEDQQKIVDFFASNKALILNDILRGRGQYSADWVLVAQKIKENARWILQPMNKVINYYDGQVIITQRGGLKIGGVGMQRKGGDNGRNTANMLQFKINPAQLFDID